MDASTENTFAGTTWIRLKNRKCRCGGRKRASIRISESSNNPGRLYFFCDACNYLEFWTPDMDERHSIHALSDCTKLPGTNNTVHSRNEIHQSLANRVYRLERAVWFIATAMGYFLAGIAIVAGFGWFNARL